MNSLRFRGSVSDSDAFRGRHGARNSPRAGNPVGIEKCVIGVA
ncbi:hypothetical protein RBSH_01631 [Rhodopirellula baltica SH28]|uniref:Uncharacterized protein n=1 Tax=Rhodopirellula baltica SH28 TaxID=993517 RepID=K5DKE5_RHOBT|nr:hypothetical protein RBSH_01631 [Rhodopirellula baltica SH28]